MEFGAIHGVGAAADYGDGDSRAPHESNPCCPAESSVSRFGSGYRDATDDLDERRDWQRGNEAAAGDGHDHERDYSAAINDPNPGAGKC
jgi:hypothetical protein